MRAQAVSFGCADRWEREILGRLHARADQIADEITDVLVAEAAVFGLERDAPAEAEVRSLARRHLDGFLFATRAGGGPSPELLAGIRDRAALRARQMVPLSAQLQSVLTAQRQILTAISREAGGDAGSRGAALSLTAKTLDYSSTVITALADAYIETAQGELAELDTARRALVDALLAWGETGGAEPSREGTGGAEPRGGMGDAQPPMRGVQGSRPPARGAWAAGAPHDEGIPGTRPPGPGGTGGAEPPMRGAQGTRPPGPGGTGGAEPPMRGAQGGRPPAVTELARRAADLGFDGGVPYLVAVVTVDDPREREPYPVPPRWAIPALARAAGLTQRTAFVVARDDKLIALLDAGGQYGHREVLAQAGVGIRQAHGAGLRAGLGGPFTGVSGFADAYRQACRALRHTSAARPVLEGPGDLLLFDELTAARDDTAELIPAATRAALSDPALRAALDAFVAADLSVAIAAKALFLHPNSLRYRLSRIAKCTGRDPHRVGDLLELIAACRVLDAGNPGGADRGHR